MQSGKTMLLLAFVVLSQASAAILTAPSTHVAVNVDSTRGEHAKAALIVAKKISPELKPASDKKFFGPPTATADYPNDDRPVVQKSIMDKLKGPHQPYPALQSKADYDRDYVKDENSDRGAWKAQFEYDHLRKKLLKEGSDVANARGRADKEGRDVGDAQRKADGAGKDVDAAKRGVNDARAGEENVKTADDFKDTPPSDENLQKIKKAVSEAERIYELEKKDFEECTRQLEEAKKNLEELKAAQVKMEQELAAETKLWVESKATRLNLKKSKEDAAHGKWVAAHEKLETAKAAKIAMDTVLAEKKAARDLSQKVVQDKKKHLENSKKQLEKATLILQKLRGYKAAPAPTKGSASMASALLSSVAVVGMYLF